MKRFLLTSVFLAIPLFAANSEGPIEITLTSCDDFKIVQDSLENEVDGDTVTDTIYPLSERAAESVSLRRSRDTEIAASEYLCRIDMSGLDTKPQRAIQVLGDQIARSIGGDLGKIFNSRLSSISPNQVLLYIGERLTFTLLLTKVESNENENLFDATLTIVVDKQTDTDP